MTSLLNLIAFVIFATTLFMRSVDPVIPQIAGELSVEPATAAMLATGFALPYALTQPVLGVLADMFSKIRMMCICVFILAVSSLIGGTVSSFEVLMATRIVGGIAAGGIFPIALAIAGDRVPVAQRQVAIGRLLFAAMAGNMLGASGAGVVGDLIGWRGVFFATGALGLLALVLAWPGLRGLDEKPGRFDLSSVIPNYRAIFSNPMAKVCYGTVFFEGLFLFGIFPHMAAMFHAQGETRASIAGIVIAGFAIGAMVYTVSISALLSHVGERRLMRGGGMVMALCLLVIALNVWWPIEFLNFVLFGFGFYMLHGVVQIYASELAPAARGTAMAWHSCFFFLGHAAGPVVYGIGLSTIGIGYVLAAGAVILLAMGQISAQTLRRAAPAKS